MTTLIIIIFILIAITSLSITFWAIIQILSNDFKGVKFEWILISMIGIIGPILFITKGRKLIIKNKSICQQ